MRINIRNILWEEDIRKIFIIELIWKMEPDLLKGDEASILVIILGKKLFSIYLIVLINTKTL